MEGSTDESSEVEEMRSSLCTNSEKAEETHSEEHKCAETAESQSLSVEVNVDAVEQEVIEEVKLDSNPNEPTDETEEKSNQDCSKDSEQIVATVNQDKEGMWPADDTPSDSTDKTEERSNQDCSRDSEHIVAIVNQDKEEMWPADDTPSDSTDKTEERSNQDGPKDSEHIVATVNQDKEGMWSAVDALNDSTDKTEERSNQDGPKDSKQIVATANQDKQGMWSDDDAPNDSTGRTVAKSNQDGPKDLKHIVATVSQDEKGVWPVDDTPNDSTSKAEAKNDQDGSKNSKHIVATVSQDEEGMWSDDDAPNYSTGKAEAKNNQDGPKNSKHIVATVSQDEEGMWSDDDASNSKPLSLVSTLRNPRLRHRAPTVYRFSPKQSPNRYAHERRTYRSRSRSFDSSRSYKARERRSRSRARRSYSPDRKAGERARSRCRRDSSTDRESRRKSRSRSRDRRDRRDYSTDRETGKNSKYRSKHRRNRKDKRKSRSRSRNRRGYSTDKEDGRKSRRRSRDRRDYTDTEDEKSSKSRNRRRSVTPYRRATHAVTSRRSRSQSQQRSDTASLSRRSHSNERNLNPRKNDRNNREKQLDGYRSDSHESLKVCATDPDRNDADQKRKQKFSSSRTAIEILRSRIQSTLKNAAAKSYPSSTITSGKIKQEVESNSFEEYRSKMAETEHTAFNRNSIRSETIQSRVEVNIDESIFNKIVRKAAFPAPKHPKLNVNPVSIAMQLNGPHHLTQNDQSSQFPVSQTSNNQTGFDRIKDPRIRKMVQAPPNISYDQQQPQPQPLLQPQHQPQPQPLLQPLLQPQHQPQHQPLHQPQHQPQLQLPSYQQHSYQQQQMSCQLYPQQFYPQQQLYQSQQFYQNEMPQHPLYQTFETQTFGSEKMCVQWGGYRVSKERKSATMTYGEYKKQQSRGNTSATNYKAKISKFIPTPKPKLSNLVPNTEATPPVEVISTVETKASSEEVQIPKTTESEFVPTQKATESASSVVPPMAEEIISREKTTKEDVVVEKKSSSKKTESVLMLEKSEDILKTDATKAVKETTKKHAVHKKHKTDKKIKSAAVDKKTSRTVHKKTKKKSKNKSVYVKSEENKNRAMSQEQSSVNKVQENAVVNGNNSSSNGMFSALQELLGLMQRVTQNNSLADVKEALKICPTDEPAAVIKKISSSAALSTSNQSKARKNELDRLHEDIDNMFIRDGVLSANGRKRTCPKREPIYSTDSDDGKQKTKMKRQSTSGNAVVKLRKQIPQLPKRSESETKHQSTSGNAAVNLREQIPQSPEGSESETERQSTSGSAVVKLRKQIPQLPEGYFKELTCSDKGPFIMLTRLVQVRKQRIKNNNLEWHSLKAVLPCKVCYDPPGISLISHYVNMHPDEEVLNSRLSPEAASCLRSSTDFPKCQLIRPEDGSNSGSLLYKQFCYFCNANRAQSKQCWISHLVRHTGYFDYKCSGCSRKFSTRAQYHTCGVPNSSIEKIIQPVFEQDNITAYVCELCNYVRFYEDEIKRHLDNEHEANEMREFKKFKFFTMPPTRKCGRPRNE